MRLYPVIVVGAHFTDRIVVRGALDRDNKKLAIKADKSSILDASVWPRSSHAGRYLRTMKWQPLAFSVSPTISVHWGVFCWLWKVFYFSGAMIRRFNRMLSSRRECCRRRRRRRHWQNGAINAGFPIRADCGEKWYIIGFECHSPPNEGLKIQLI